MWKYLVLLFCVLLPLISFSQSTVVLLNGTEYKGKVTLKTGKIIQLREGGENGELKDIDRKMVNKIVHDNGDVELINKKFVADTETLKRNEELFHQQFDTTPKPFNHIISISLYEAAMAKLGLRYELLSPKENYGIRIPFSYKGEAKYWDLGIEGRFYLLNTEYARYNLGNLDLGAGRFRYFLGPSIYSVRDKYDDRNDKRIETLVTNGLSFQLGVGLNVATSLGLGISGNTQTNGVKTSFGSTAGFMWRLDITVGWKFGGKKA